MHNLLESNMDNIFNNWAISEESRPEFEHHQPNNASERTFKNRPGDSEDVAFTPLDRIPHRHFYYYYNTLNDRIVPQLTLPCQAVLSVLFRRSHGFNRNWCQMSLPQLERATGASRNTIRKHLKTLIEAGWICIVSDGYHEATTYGMRIPVTINETPAENHAETPTEIPELETPIPACVVHRTADGSPDIEDQNPSPSPQSIDEQAEASDTQEQGVRGSKIARQKLTPCTSSTCTKSKTGIKPGFHPWQYPQNYVHTDPISTGENRVTDNPNDKKYHRSLPSTKPVLEKSYLKSLPKKKVGEIYRAQDAWDEILGPDTRPTAAKLNQMLQYMRGWYRGENLDTKFRWCLEDTRKKRPRDAVAWLISALKHGRYPNIVMSKPRWEGIGNSSPRPKTSRTQSVNDPGKAPDARSGLDRPAQTCEAAAEREKRRATSPHRELWEKVLKNIGEKVHDQSLETWFEPLFITKITETTVVFDAPEQLIADWVGINYTDFLKAELEVVGIFDRAIVIKTPVRS